MKRTRANNLGFADTTENIREGETMVNKVRRILLDKEPITDGAPIVYTEKKDGVRPEFDIRTDKWQIAENAMDKVAAAKIAKSKETGNKKEDNKSEPPVDSGGSATES